MFRMAARAIILDRDDRRILILYNEAGQYYKLPGGGIEADELHTDAVERETLEETGCVVHVLGKCVGVVGM